MKMLDIGITVPDTVLGTEAFIVLDPDRPGLRSALENLPRFQRKYLRMLLEDIAQTLADIDTAEDELP